MELHANAALSVVGRRRLIELIPVLGLVPAAEAVGTSPKTARKWWRRWLAEGEAGLLDRSSRPHSSPNQTPPGRVDAIRKLRKIRLTGPDIAELLGMAVSTVSAVLRREGMGKLGRIGQEPARVFEVSRPGEVVHVDVKKLGRIRGGAGHRVTGRGPGSYGGNGAGWECVHVAIDGYSRLAYAEVLPDEKALTTVGFLRRARTFFRAHGIEIERIHSDNGANYRSNAFALALKMAGLRHTRSRAYRPQTNGKAERFIRTMTGGWAYGAIYGSSAERSAALAGWLERYNYRRPHAALNRRTPASRTPMQLTGNNLPGPYS